MNIKKLKNKVVALSLSIVCLFIGTVSVQAAYTVTKSDSISLPANGVSCSLGGGSRLMGSDNVQFRVTSLSSGSLSSTDNISVGIRKSDGTSAGTGVYVKAVGTNYKLTYSISQNVHWNMFATVKSTGTKKSISYTYSY